MDNTLIINPGKRARVEAMGQSCLCYAIRTPTVVAGDDVAALVRAHAAPHMRQGDILLVSEKMLACAQGRAIPLEAIRPGRLARWLSGFVTRSPSGIGLSMPETMACAIDECGAPRILLAAAAGALGRLLGVKGWFYRVAGVKAAGIDGPCPNTLPPYNRHVVLLPHKPRQAARQLSRALGGAAVWIVDINDLGGRILASSHRLRHPRRAVALLRQNPLGQGCQSTPLGLLRPGPGGHQGCGGSASLS